MKKEKNKFMGVCKVGEKGQIVIPKEARDMFSIAPGDTVVVLCDKKRGMAIVKADFFEGITENIFGKGSDK
ncbi:MAG: AbrB/MazE/SpoVT family DNA-binding domain-containing protein [Clostridia bacterium]|nr:AbrB/MazE/SpoVT family DNA-binding domain-containing protein [Clostridia bacterium]MDD4387320.1 AbrB/MazE/SpoVT family DNA-binding domain-containing protein [Clostridia bacterium]